MGRNANPAMSHDGEVCWEQLIAKRVRALLLVGRNQYEGSHYCCLTVAPLGPDPFPCSIQRAIQNYLKLYTGWDRAT